MKQDGNVQRAEAMAFERWRALTGGVLLTGARGYLGVHLLSELLEHSTAVVTCLVRAESASVARKALLQRLCWYFPRIQWEEYGHRVRALPGDIEKPRLGLGAMYDEVASQASVIMNAAADVRHIGGDAHFLRANTDSVAALIEFAQHGNPKELHHISSTSVRGYFSLPGQLGWFDETCLEEGQLFENAYGQSKYQAEVLLRCAFSSGMRGAVYRVGYLGPHSGSGRFQENIGAHSTSRYVRACVRLGLAPYLPHVMLRLTPVDSAARAILTLGNEATSNGKTYHIDTPHEISQYDVIRILQAAGFAIRVLDARDFAEKVPHVCDDEALRATLLPGDGDERHVPALDSNWTLGELENAGFEYPVPSNEWLVRFIGHAIAVGFLEAPRFWNLASRAAELL